MMSKKGIYGVFLLLWPLLSHAWPEFQRPDFVKQDWVAANMVRNGMPMYIENISCDCPYENILVFYRKLWKNMDDKGFVETDLGELKQISRGDEHYFYSVQVKADVANSERSVGRLVISEIPKAGSPAVVLGEGIPMMGDSVVMTDIYDAMPGKKSRTVLLVNTRSIVQNMQFYRSHYEKLGWKSFLFPVNPDLGSQALSYQMGDTDVNVTITDQFGASVVLVNEVKTAF